MKKQIIVASIVYTFLSVLQPLANFVLLPVYTKYFSESQFGVFSILNNLNIFFSIISGLGIIHAIIAFHSTYNDNKSDLCKYVGNVLSFTFYSNLAILAFMYFTGEIIFKFIFKQNIDFFPDGFLSVSYGLCSNIVTGYLYFLKYEKNILRFAFISFLQFFLSTVLQYVCVVDFNMGITGALTARLIVTLFCLLLVIIYHYNYLFAKINFSKFITPSLKYSLNTIPASIIAWLCSYGDRFLIERFIDLQSLGVYSFLSTISSLTEMIFLALGSAIQPFIFDFFKAENKARAINLYRMFILLSTCGASFIIMAGSNLKLIIHNNGYLSIVEYLTIMTIGYIFSAITYLFNLQVIYKKKSHYFLYLGLIVLTSNLSLNALLIPRFGIWGVVVSSTLTKLISAITSTYFARKSFPLYVGKNNYLALFFIILVIIAFWVIGSLDYFSLSTTGILQFVTILSMVTIFYRKIIRKSINELSELFRKSN